MKLYGSYTSPFVRHCRIALAEAELSFEFIETAGASPDNKSPTKRVPYMVDGELRLTDSSSILKHVREQAGGTFITKLEDFDLYCLVNTVMDTAINVMLFERIDGLGPSDSKYLARQEERVQSSLLELSQRELPTNIARNDAGLRLACFLDWALFRQRISLDKFETLRAFLDEARSNSAFAVTAPPTK